MLIQEIVEKTGGYAMKDAGVSRIKKVDIPATIKYVSTLSGIPIKDLHKVGSVGKVSDSGDIDLAVDSTKYNPTEIHNKMILALDGVGTYNSANKIASYAIPIRGKEGNNKVQVDFMFTPNVEWAKFSYHSEGENSKYKGAIRAILLAAVATTKHEPGIDHFEYDKDGELLVRVGRSFDLSQGLSRIFQHRPKRKDGTGYLSTLKSVSKDDFKVLFPDLSLSNDKLLIDDPNKVVKVLFGGNTTPNDVRTAEQIIHLIKKKFDDDKQNKIFKAAARRAKGIVSKMKLPPEILERM